MDAFLEIMKYTLPSLVVFATAYYLLKQHLDARYSQALLSQKLEAQKITLPLRLQAYERFALLCDRVAIPNLLLRVRTPEMTVRDLQASMLASVRMEFEHNIALQVYISETLWQIISLAVEDTVAQIMRASAGLEPTADGTVLANALSQALQNEIALLPLQKAVSAIRTEVSAQF